MIECYLPPSFAAWCQKASSEPSLKHPHSRGENGWQDNLILDQGGPSPLAWEERVVVAYFPFGDRTIPTVPAAAPEYMDQLV
jgi:hypothetical protein